MKRTVIIMLIFMLIFLEGCSITGLVVGSRLKKTDNFKEPFIAEEVEAIKINSSVEVESKDYGLIKGKFLSFKNDTLKVIIKPKNFNKIFQNLNKNDLLIYNDNYLYVHDQRELGPHYILMIPVDRINSLRLVYGSKAFILGLAGAVIDLGVFFYFFIQNNELSM